MQLTLITLQGSTCSLFLAALCGLQSSLESSPCTGPAFRGGFCCCLCFPPWNVLFLDVGGLAESYSVYLYVQDMSAEFKNPLHLHSVSRVFLLRSIKVAVHQFLIGAGLINEQLRAAVLQLQLPDTDIASLCQGIQLFCTSNQYLLL